jgi:peptidoglycan/xylan/chitin deacetylase (PgdA/CDA1 family)
MSTARLLFWVATAGAFALVVRSFWLGPVPLPVAFVSLLGYSVLVVLGYIFPRWGMFADVIDEAMAGRNVVGLSFDDGPEPSSTPEVLATLARYEAHATFFVIGRKVEAHPELIAQILAGGHELGLHGYAHSRFTAFRSTKWMKQDFERARQLVAQHLTTPLRWFRPPIGHVTPRLAKIIKDMDLSLVCWTIRGLDGVPGMKQEKVASRVISRLRDGAIIAMHDAFENKPGMTPGAEALGAVLEAMKQRGLRGVTVTELLEG